MSLLGMYNSQLIKKLTRQKGCYMYITGHFDRGRQR